MKTYLRVERRYSHHDKQNSSYQRLAPICRDAMIAGCYLFNKETKEWFTPEEFESEYSTRQLLNYEVNDLLENLVVRDPIAGVKAANNQLDTLEMKLTSEIKVLREKLQEFTKEVISYYQNKAKS